MTRTLFAYNDLPQMLADDGPLGMQARAVGDMWEVVINVAQSEYDAGDPVGYAARIGMKCDFKRADDYTIPLVRI